MEGVRHVDTSVTDALVSSHEKLCTSDRQLRNPSGRRTERRQERQPLGMSLAGPDSEKVMPTMGCVK